MIDSVCHFAIIHRYLPSKVECWRNVCWKQDQAIHDNIWNGCFRERWTLRSGGIKSSRHCSHGLCRGSTIVPPHCWLCPHCHLHLPSRALCRTGESPQGIWPSEASNVVLSSTSKKPKVLFKTTLEGFSRSPERCMSLYPGTGGQAVMLWTYTSSHQQRWALCVSAHICISTIPSIFWTGKGIGENTESGSVESVLS